MHIAWFYSYKGPEQVKLIYVLKISYLSYLWGVVIKRRQERFQECWFLDLRASYVGLFSLRISIKLYIHDFCIFLYVCFNEKLIKILSMNRE